MNSEVTTALRQVAKLEGATQQEIFKMRTEIAATNSRLIQLEQERIAYIERISTLERVAENLICAEAKQISDGLRAFLDSNPNGLAVALRGLVSSGAS